MKNLSIISFRILTIGFSLGLLLPANAFAQPAATGVEDHNVIVVLGDKERKAKVNDFLQSALVVKEGQYARYSAPVCPEAMGFSEEYNDVIEKRMRRVAKAAGAEMAKTRCKPNLILIAIKDPKTFIKKLRNRHPSALGEMSIPDRDTMMKGPGPTFAWNLTFALGGGGSSRSNSGGTGGSSSSIDGRSGGLGSFAGSGSRINTSISRSIKKAVLVVDKTALLDVNLRQLADYAVMRLLANTDEPAREDVTERSILSLFSDQAAGFEMPESVSAWDLALLRSLYKTKTNVSASRQRAAMASMFDEELVKIAENNTGD